MTDLRVSSDGVWPLFLMWSLLWLGRWVIAHATPVIHKSELIIVIYAHSATTAYHGLIALAVRLPIWRPWWMQTIVTKTDYFSVPWL